MKRILFNTIFTLCFFASLQAQAPFAICYQAIATDQDGQEVVNQQLGVKISILKGLSDKIPVYVEIHNKKTDDFGLFTLEIGKGIVTTLSSLDKIEWGNDKYFIKTEIDPSGGTNYITMGVSELISIPYAFYANQAYHVQKADTAKYAQKANHAKSAGIITNDKDISSTNELQQLSFSNGKLKLIPSALDNREEVSIQDADGDPKNEIQNLGYDNKSGYLSLSNKIDANISKVNLFDGLFLQPAASLYYPLGLIGAYKNIGIGRYTVPLGKTFFVTAGPESFTITGVESGDITHRRLPNFPVFKGGTILKDCKCTGLLMDNSNLVTAEIIDFKAMSIYTVPQGKALIIKSGLVPDGYLVINNVVYKFTESPSLAGVIVLQEGTTIKNLTSTKQHMVLTGYLIPHQSE